MMTLKQNSSNIYELKMLYEITKALKTNLNFSYSFDSVYEIVKDFWGIKDLNLCLKDSNDENFKLSYSRDKEQYRECIGALNTNKTLEKSFLQDNLLVLYIENEFRFFNSLDDFDINLKLSDAKLLFPIIDKKELVGIVGFSEPTKLDGPITLNFIMITIIIANQLSYIILNERLNKMVSSVASISTATKDIAKIIETQYELNYVVPIMGEILDKYLPNALVYMFLKNNDNGFELSWPSSYSSITVDPLLNELDSRQENVLSCDKQAIALPICVKGNLKGAIVADAKVTELSEKELDVLKELSKQCNITISRAVAYAETVKHATVDALTGLNNRRQLDKRLLQEASIVIRTKRPLSLLMIDIDYFKNVNDTHGHSVGDYVLREVAKIIVDATRDYDVCGRYGGEEFAIILPDTNKEGALILAERIRQRTEQKLFNIGKFASSKSDTLNITLSIGVSLFDSDLKNPADVYEEADIALYKAKQEGRNRVITFADN